MPNSHRSIRIVKSRLPGVLLVILLVVLLIGGGASRADVPGQALVRGVAWLLLIVAILFGNRPAHASAKVPLMFLLAGILLALLQLVPLPPAVWQALPGRAPLAELASAIGQPQPWRPWAIVPGAAANALSALVVPLVVLLFLAGLREGERRWLPGLMLALIVAAALIGLMQVSGLRFNNPLINETAGEVGGTFANRNHFALFLAFGCVIAPVWAFSGGRELGWRAPVALGLALLFTLTILATGSRAGLALGALALAIGLTLSHHSIRRALLHAPRWVFPTLIGVVVSAITIFVLLSVATDRAISIQRAIASDTGQDLRIRALPTVLEMIRAYFPAGSGLGGFDPIFRMHEPFPLLTLLYFNHAHNDFLEIVLDAGLPAALLLLMALGWWAWFSVRAWRAGTSASHALPKLGSAILLLVILASLVDYPARTPMIMAITAIAAVWLADVHARQAALPDREQHL